MDHLPLLIDRHIEHVVTEAKRTLDLSEQLLNLVVAWSGEVELPRVHALPSSEDIADVGRTVPPGGRIGGNMFGLGCSARGWVRGLLDGTLALREAVFKVRDGGALASRRYRGFAHARGRSTMGWMALIGPAVNCG